MKVHLKDWNVRIEIKLTILSGGPYIFKRLLQVLLVDFLGIGWLLDKYLNSLCHLNMKRLIRHQILCATLFWRQNGTATQKVIYMKHEFNINSTNRKSTTFPHDSKLVKNAPLRVAFATLVSVCGNMVKRGFSCLMYYLYPCLLGKHLTLYVFFVQR